MGGLVGKTVGAEVDGANVGAAVGALHGVQEAGHARCTVKLWQAVTDPTLLTIAAHPA